MTFLAVRNEPRSGIDGLDSQMFLAKHFHSDSQQVAGKQGLEILVGLCQSCLSHSFIERIEK